MNKAQISYEELVQRVIVYCAKSRENNGPEALNLNYVVKKIGLGREVPQAWIDSLPDEIQRRGLGTIINTASGDQRVKINGVGFQYSNLSNFQKISYSIDWQKFGAVAAIFSLLIPFIIWWLS